MNALIMYNALMKLHNEQVLILWQSAQNKPLGTNIYFCISPFYNKHKVQCDSADRMGNGVGYGPE